MESILFIVVLCGISFVFTHFFQIKVRKKKLFTSKVILPTERNINLPLRNLSTLYKKKQLNEEKDKRLVDNAILLVQANFSDPYFNGEALASKLNTSQRNLQRKFKAVKQSSPSKIIRELRLEFAVSQLNEGKTIKSVVFDSGFSSQSYFNKCFKARFGCTPSEFLYERNG